MAKKKANKEPNAPEEPTPYEVLASTRPRMTILSDGPLPGSDVNVPGSGVNADGLHLAQTLSPVFDILRHPKTQTPLAVAIYGKWGSGKTSAMRWLEAMCNYWNASGEDKVEVGRGKKKETKVFGQKVRTVWFCPWKYHDRVDVWRGLISEVILKSIDISEPTPGRITKAVKSFGVFLGRGFLHALESISVKAGVPGAEVEVDLAGIRDIWEEYDRAAHPEKGFLNEFESTLRSWVRETISSRRERMVVFIDDLDRCLPTVMLEVLEALKLYLDIEDLVFVLGLDRAMIDQVVKKKYADSGVDPADAEHYLDKMFQVEVTVQPSDVQIKGFLNDQLEQLNEVAEDYWQQELTDDERKIFHDVVLRLAEQNPREVKRLLNSMTIHGAGAMQARGKGP